MNLSPTIVPKSDQLNSDSLQVGPLTIKVTAVKSGSSEQPVVIHYEGDEGRPYKPGKSMRRVLVGAWGPDGDKYIGRRLTLYCDKGVKWAGEEVGGIRISHMSELTEPFEIALTVTRGKRKPFTVQPLAPAPQIDIQALTDIGDTKAGEGKDALRAWWESLTPAVRTALKDKLPAWKERAV